MSVQIIQGDSREQLPLLAADSIDAVITDPPYALVSITKRWSGDGPPPREGVYRRSTAGFMGKAWDTGETAFDPAFWSEVLRVMKPGAHLIAFGGTRTYHRLVCAIEDAGFEIRDQLAWLFGSGFPKSHDVSKGIDKAAGAEREVIGPSRRHSGTTSNHGAVADLARYAAAGDVLTAPATAEAAQWQGWGSALKPAWETICLARKPLTERPLCDTIGSKITELEGALWSMLSARDAERLFGLNRSAFAEATSASARWIAAEGFNTRAALSGQTDTSPSELAMISSLNTVWSWLRTWAELCSVESTSTTETGSNTTIDWQTLSCCLSRITPESIIQDHKAGHGPIASACPAARLFSAELSRLGAILELSAQGPVTSQDRQSSLGAGVNLEPIVLARKPLIGTIAANVLKHGTGALNIDACRVDAPEGVTSGGAPTGGNNPCFMSKDSDPRSQRSEGHPAGRWPANVIHDGSPEVLAGFPETQSGDLRPDMNVKASTGWSGGSQADRVKNEFSANSGSAARFFYTPKADKADRCLSKHPTVKPIDLMAYLIKLVTPPGGTVLDCFAGSGSTGMAAMREGFNAILIEREAEYVRDIQRRLDHVHGHDTPLFAEIAS